MDEKKYQSFEDLIVWKQGMELCIEVYKSMKECRDFGFRDQIQRAAVSIPSNIAEGFERQTDKEFVQYLFIAKGSCGEVRTQLYLAAELEHLQKPQAGELVNKAKKLSSMIQNLIKVRKH
ncbi:four helix bundle protein [Persicitalea jodogahamensis]|uniref:Four helix bundle protein n=1 Tax=Persicitalea jodogahamensis TaxID=402147 RepID=A0A8J3D9Z9_9BACT|nr:four helix bundle protein [Persicitalea jodogahamensis]GHB67136.1 four helix bundle protein [Persicitalea jodogahamensis]